MDEQTRIERINLGHASAYAYYKAGGGTGTEEEFTQWMADLGIQVEYLENMAVVTNTLEPGTPASATYEDGVLTLNIPKGEKGDPAPQEEVTAATDAWLQENITNPSNPPLDRSLTLANAATPADITGELKSAFELDEADFEAVKDATVVNKKVADIEYTDDEQHVYWRYINGAWELVETSGAYYNHISTFPVTAGKLYRVTGRHAAYTPLATFWTDEGATPFACTPDGYSADQTGEIVTLDVFVPEGATKMVVTGFPLDTFPTVTEFEYVCVSELISDPFVVFESGTFQDANGTVKSSNSARIRNSDILDIRNLASMTIPSGFSAYIFLLDADKTEISTVTWRSGKINIPSIITSNTYYINFAIRKDDATSSDISAYIPTIQQNTLFVSNLRNTMTVVSRVTDELVYCTFDERYVSFEANGSGMDITLPYRFYIHYLSEKSSAEKTLASGVSSITYECANNTYLVFDLEDNTVKQWTWSNISVASKDKYILFANVANAEIVGGILKPYLNRYKLKLIENENYPTTLKRLRESALGVGFDTNVVKFARTSIGLDITLPYRCYIFGDKFNNIYEKKLNGLDTGSFTISWDMSGYIVLDITTGTVSIDSWSDITSRTDPFIVLAYSGKRVYINDILYPVFGAGALLPYFNQWVLSETDSEINNRLIPPYYYFINDYLPDKVVSIREKAKVADVSFGFLTDFHVEYNTERSMLLMKYIADATNAVPFVLFGGDVPKATGTEEDALASGDKWLEIASIYGKENVYQCKGNHDYMINITDSPTFYADVKTDYYYICKPTEQKVQGEPGKLYYYFDDEVNKVRYIVLDNYDAGYSSGHYNTTGMSQTQYDWLLNLLDVDGYDVLVLSHQTSDTTLNNYESVLAPLQEILKAFVAKSTLSYSGNGVTLSADFAGNTSRLICHLSGHSHDDESHVDDGVLSIVTVCDAYYSVPSGYNRTMSTVNEQAFDIICITKDTGSGYGSIELIRIGAGEDRSFTF